MINEYFNDFFDQGIQVDSSNMISLNEKGDSAKLKNVKIDMISTYSKVIKSDKVSIENLFNRAGKGQRTHCDYLIITNNKVIFIELKSSFKEGDSFQKISNQFKGTLCITDYIDSVLFNFYDKKKFFANIEKKYILLYKNSPIDLRSSKEIKSEKKNQLEHIKMIQVDNDQIVTINELE